MDKKLFLALILVLSFLVSGCAQESVESNKTGKHKPEEGSATNITKEAPELGEAKLEIVRSNELNITERSEGMIGKAVLTGVVKNTGKRQVRMGWVLVYFYQRNPEFNKTIEKLHLDTARDKIEKLDPGEKTEFSVVCEPKACSVDTDIFDFYEVKTKVVEP